MRRSILLSLGLVAMLCATLVHADRYLTLNTPAGQFTGYNTSMTWAFRGIPFAKPPVGDLRWKAPVKADYVTALNATNDGPACPQQCVCLELPPHTCPDVQNEDCLYLNVFVPFDAPTKGNKPVMVYLHGGNYKQGFGGGPLYNGTYLGGAQDEIIVVGNYRLGALGFLASPEDGVDGNYGFLDQVALLQWVQSNIQAFGGNPNHVTLVGQSAGAGSIATHLISPLSKGLFHAAVLHSNPYAIPFRNANSMPAIVKALLKHANCANVDCLRTLPADQMIQAQVATEVDLNAAGDSLLHAFLPWTPYVDGKVVPDQPLLALQKGNFNAVPTMIGTVFDESVPFVYGAFSKPVDSFSYQIVASLIFGSDRATRVVQKYPPPASGDARETLVTVGSEFIFHCAVRNATRALASRAPTFLYMYDHVMSFGEAGWGPQFPECWNRCCHAAELAFLWNSAQWMFPYTPAEIELARNMGDYWGQFIRSYTPSQNNANEPTTHPFERLAQLVGLSAKKSGLPTWPQYSQNNEKLLYISASTDSGIQVIDKWYSAQCDFWDSIGYF